MIHAHAGHIIPAIHFLPGYTAASLSPTATETVFFETGFGLECYTDRASAVQYEHAFWVALEDVVGIPTLEQTVSDWWENRPDRFKDPVAPLTRSPIEDNKVAFRDENGNAQLLLLGEEFGNGVWTVGHAEDCFVPPSFIPR